MITDSDKKKGSPTIRISLGKGTTGMRVSVLILALVLFLSTEAHSTIVVENVVSGIQGFARADRWVPIVLNVTSTSGDFHGTIEINQGMAFFRKSIDLAARTKKRIVLLAYVSSYYGPLGYRILDENGIKVKDDRLQVTTLNAKDNLVLVISEQEYNHQFLNGVPNPWGGKTFVSYLKPDELFSEWIAYSVADAIVLGSISKEKISAPEWKAIIQYAASGGILVCSSATSNAILENPVVRKALPMRSSEYGLVSKGEFQPSPVQFPEIVLPIQKMSLRSCDTLLLQDAEGNMLTASSPFYKGNIIYFAFDYTRLPEQVRTQFASIWNDLLYPSTTGPPPFSIPFRQRLEENPRVQRFLYDIPGLRLPEQKWFALFFFLYLCAIGPFQYLLLKMLKKTYFLWITFPALILIFSLASFGYSRVRQTGQRITQVAVIEIFPQLETQFSHQIYGTAMVQSGTFRFQAVPENSYMSKFALATVTGTPEPYTLVEDIPRGLVGEGLKNWTFRTFEAVGMAPVAEQVTVAVHIDGNVLTGKVVNDSSQEMERAFFVYDSKNSVMLGNIAPRNTRNFTLALSNSTTIPFTEIHLRNLLNLYNLSYSNPHFLFGEVHTRGEFLINGNSRGTECLKYVAVFVQTEEGEPGNIWMSEKGIRKMMNSPYGRVE